MQNTLEVTFASCENRHEVTLFGSFAEINRQLEEWVMNEHGLMTVKEAQQAITDDIEILSLAQVSMAERIRKNQHDAKLKKAE